MGIKQLALALLGLAAVLGSSSAQTDDCNDQYKSKDVCQKNGCSWCECAAVPSACFTKEHAAQLPAAVYKCDPLDEDSKQSGKENDVAHTAEPTKGRLEITMERQSRDKFEEILLGKGGLRGVTGNPHLCDNVNQLAGYFRLEEQNKHYFFYMFESRSDPSNDPVILWLTGGPGCSSGIALYVENGPCHISKDGMKTTKNPYSWNEKANVIYVDQPAGTGFSYGTHDRDEKSVSTDLYEFLAEFFTAYPQYAKNDFFIFGESYAGHYVPATAHKIWTMQKNTKPEDRLINFKGMSVGNGLTDVPTQISKYADMAYQSGTAPARVSKATYTIMKNVATPAALAAAKLCNTLGDFVTCTAAQEIMSLGLMIPYVASGYNQYDMRIKCEVPGLCYNFSNVDTYLNRKDIQQALGVDKKWQSCDQGVHMAMLGDYMTSFQDQIPALLADGIKVLIYAGDQDYICNWLGNQEWVRKLEWPGKEAYNQAPEQGFIANGKEAGKLQTAGGLGFLQVYQAGHMVPMDQPQAALEMVQRFTINQNLV